MATPNSFGGFLFDDGLGQAGKFSRGVRIKVYNLLDRQIYATIVAHNPGAIRTASRDPAKIIEFHGHVWGNPSYNEAGLVANLDTLEAAFANGVQQLCVHDDGRYFNAELINFEPEIAEGDIAHSHYLARFLCNDPYAYAAVAVGNRLSSTTAIPLVTGTLYQQSWTSGTSDQLGSAPSAYRLTVTIGTSNGCFALKLANLSVIPSQIWTIAQAGGFAGGTIVTFDSANAQGLITVAGVTGRSTMPVLPITLNSRLAIPTSLQLSARASGGAPVVTLDESFTARYR